jgi:hypothetical protein
MKIKATYRGKIGRLPKTVREELNRRLDNGEAGRRLIAWLNSLPGADPERPIIASNLSRWKSGGDNPSHPSTRPVRFLVCGKDAL